ncbi:restriction endonuclease subunit S [Pseudoxanthomonas mexicana]
MKVVTLESITSEGGLITDGDWIESRDQDPTGTIRLIQLADIGDGRFLDKSSKFVNDATSLRLNCTLLQAGDVLIARMPDPLGRACVFPKLERRAITAVDVCIVRPDPRKVDPEWLSFRLNSRELRSEIQTHAQGATRSRVPTGKLKGISFGLPSLPEQQRIAVRLKAELSEVEIAKQAAKAQMRDAKLLRQRLLRKTFDALHDVPRKVLGEWAKTTSGSTPPRGDRRYWSPAEIPWVKTGEVAFAPITQTEESISRQALKECSLTLLPPKSVLIAMYGQGKTRGQSAILETEATTNQACFAIFPNDTWDAEFLHHWLMASYEDLRGLSEGRGGNQANLNGALLNALEIPAPRMAVQQSIVRRLKKQLAETDAIHQAAIAQLAEIERLPQKLLAQAFPPQGDVK